MRSTSKRYSPLCGRRGIVEDTRGGQGYIKRIMEHPQGHLFQVDIDMNLDRADIASIAHDEIEQLPAALAYYDVRVRGYVRIE